MQKIYMHVGGTYYDPDQLQATKDFELGLRDKPQYGLWASLFNDKEAYTWERFATVNFNQTAHRHADELKRRESQRFESYLKDMGYSKEEFYDLPRSERAEIKNSYDSSALAYTEEEMQMARELDRQEQYQYGVAQRDNSFTFVVDQNKILQVEKMSDIASYMKRHQFGNSGRSCEVIDFDRIKADGYGGVELHNACQLHYGIFNTWNVDSIVIWDPDCVHEVPKEIAYIARSIADAKDAYDDYDILADDVSLARWLADNIPTIKDAIANGILTQQEVEQFVEHAIELDEQSRACSSQMKDDFGQEESVIEIDR